MTSTETMYRVLSKWPPGQSAVDAVREGVIVIDDEEHLIRRRGLDIGIVFHNSEIAQAIAAEHIKHGATVTIQKRTVTDTGWV